jgi:hypothetical protein
MPGIPPTLQSGTRTAALPLERKCLALAVLRERHSLIAFRPDLVRGLFALNDEVMLMRGRAMVRQGGAAQNRQRYSFAPDTCHP